MRLKEVYLKLFLMSLNRFTYLCFASAFFFGCGQGKKTITDELLLHDLKRDTTLNYAKRFAILENEKCKVIYLFGNVDIQDTTATYIILKDTSLKVKTGKNTFLL